MYPVKIEWIKEEDGGKKIIPSNGRYFPVSRFPEEDLAWPSDVWSVVFELEAPINEKGKTFSYGLVRFLVDKAPQDRMHKYKNFEIYEGPKKVANVFLLNNL